MLVSRSIAHALASLLVLTFLTSTARSQSAFPTYEIIDVRHLYHQNGWISREGTDELIRLNGKDVSVRLGRGWLQIGDEKYQQQNFTLRDVLLTLDVPVTGGDYRRFPFNMPELVGPYLGNEINEEGDFADRRWYAKSADSGTHYGFVLPVGTDLIALDVFDYSKEVSLNGRDYYLRLIFYEATEGIIELERAEDGYEFTEEDVLDDQGEGLEFTEEDLANLSDDEDGYEFTEEDVLDDQSEGLEFTEEDLADLSDAEDGYVFSEDDVRDDAEGLEFTDEDVRDDGSWQRDMTAEQQAEAQEFYDNIINCAETGTNCPEGLDADALAAGRETDSDAFEETARAMAEDSVLGKEVDDNGWPKSMPDYEAELAQRDYEQTRSCIASGAECPEYIDKSTAAFFFENAEPAAAEKTIRDIIAKEISRQTQASYEEVEE